MTQGEFDWRRGCEPQEDAETLCAVLGHLTHGNRMSIDCAASQCAAETGEAWTRRRVRDAAEAAGGDVLRAPGVLGYRLARDTDCHDYIATERARYLSQIKSMTRALIQMDRKVFGKVKKTVDAGANVR
jgi:Flp pilus assembly protein TadD